MATVLIVEDEDQLRRSLALCLACRGITVAEADTVETAIEALEAFATPFDVILLDINLPDGTGWDVLRYLRERAGGSAFASQAQRPPHVIAVTAAQPAQCRLDEFELAVFLLKPFPMEVLVRLLDRVLTGRPRAGAAASDGSADVGAGRTSSVQTQHRPVSEANVPRDDAKLDVEDAFGDHDIEYWVRRGNKLVPATEDEVAQIHEWERESSALARLPLWEQQQTGAGTGLARLLHGLGSARHRLGRSHPLLAGGGDEQRQRQRHQRPTIKSTEARTRPARD